MKIDLEHWDGRKVFQTVYDELYSYWVMLQKRYHLDDVLFILTRSDELLRTKIEIHHMFCEHKNKPFSYDGLMKYITDLTSNIDSCFTSCFGYNEDPNGKVYPMQYIGLATDAVIEHLFMHRDRIEEVTNFFKVCILHEVGHCLCNIDTGNRVKDARLAADESDRISYESYTTFNDWKHTWEGQPGIPVKEFLEAYHNLPVESAANSAVGLTWKDHYDTFRDMIGPDADSYLMPIGLDDEEEEK